MAPKRRKRSWVPLLPMHVGQREQEQIATALAAVDAGGSANERAEAVLVRQQLALHASYVEACGKLEVCADAMRASGAHLVPLRFPLRLTPRTRTSVEDGVHRSFLRFLQDLHATVEEVQHAGALGNAAVDPHVFLGKLANVLTLELCRVLDGSVSNAEATEVCVTYVGKCRAAAVREESAQLLGLDAACEVVTGVLARFSTRSAKISRAVPEKMRAFLRASERKGLSAAARRLAREPQLHEAVAKHRAWLFADDCDDAKLARIYELLLLTHLELAQALSWQRRRVAWLAAASSANMCWCGITVGMGMEGVLVHAPAHMRCFAGDERVRLMAERREAPFACYLSLAGVANVVIELLRTARLSLNRIDATYASRILTFDFCKYESAARNILEDTVRPWCDRVLHSGGVN